MTIRIPSYIDFDNRSHAWRADIDYRTLPAQHPAVLRHNFPIMQAAFFYEGGAMVAIVTPDAHKFPWYVRLFFWNQKRRYGAVLEPSRLWGRTPRVFVALALLYGALDRRSSPIGPALRTLVTVRVSQINWCHFCVDVNAATALKRGIVEEKLLAIAAFRDSALFSEQEKSALAYAEAMTYTDRPQSEEEFAGLRAHFSEDAIIELTALIAFQNLSSKFNAALQVPAQGFCAVAPALARNNETV